MLKWFKKQESDIKTDIEIDEKIEIESKNKYESLDICLSDTMAAYGDVARVLDDIFGYIEYVEKYNLSPFNNTFDNFLPHEFERLKKSFYKSRKKMNKILDKSDIYEEVKDILRTIVINKYVPPIEEEEEQDDD